MLGLWDGIEVHGWWVNGFRYKERRKGAYLTGIIGHSTLVVDFFTRLEIEKQTQFSQL